MKKFRNNICQLIYGIGLYILFFNPNLIFLGSITVKVLYPLLFIGSFVHLKMYGHILRDLWFETALLLLILIYGVILTLFSDGDVEILKGIVMLAIGCMLIPSLVVALNRNFTFKTILRLVLRVGIVSCLISYICFAFPELNAKLRDLQFMASANLVDLSFRGFGISNGLFFYYPIVLSLILIIYLEGKHTMLSKLGIGLLFLFAVFINARIGVFPLVIYGILKCIRSFKILIALIIGIVLLILLIIYIGNEYEDTTFGFICKWILGGIGQVTNPLLGTDFDTFGERHFDTLGKKMMFAPVGIDNIVFGTGINIYGRSSGVKSDMGYIIQLYYGGILICMLIASLIMIMSYRLYHWMKYAPEKRNLILMLFVSTIFISDFKGDFIFQMNSGFLFLYFCYTQLNLLCRHQKFFQS